MSAAPAGGSARRTVTVRSWCRADLAGGTLDIWPLGLLFPSAVTVNVALDLAVGATLSAAEGAFEVIADGRTTRHATAEAIAADPDWALIGVVARHLDLPPVRIELTSDSPRGGGLGASSALTVALIAAADAWCGRPPRGESATARLARDLEAVLMALPTGTQDHYPAMLGGALEIRYQPGGEAVTSMTVDVEGLGRCLHVAYSGRSHFSAATNWSIVRGCLEGGAPRRRLGRIAGIAEELSAQLSAGDLARVGQLMGEEWSERRELAEGVSVAAVEELLGAAAAVGAWGGKACGAGGGGCVAVLAPPERRAEVRRALAAAGGDVLEARPTSRPWTLVETGVGGAS